MPDNAVQAVNLGELVKDGMGSGDTGVNTLIALAKAAVVQEIGMPDPDTCTEAEWAVFNANVEHGAAVNLANMTGKASIAFRMQAYNMHRSGAFNDIRIPRVDAISGQITGYERFSNYDRWFDYVAELAHLDDTIASTTRSCIKRLMPLIDNGVITHEYIDAGEGIDTIQPITAADIMRINRANLEVAMPAIGKLIDRYALDRQTTHLNAIGNIVDAALTMTRQSLKSLLSQRGLRGDRLTQLECYTMTLPDGSVAYTIVADEAGQHYLDGILASRLNVHMVELEELLPILHNWGQSNDDGLTSHPLGGLALMT